MMNRMTPRASIMALKSKIGAKKKVARPIAAKAMKSVAKGMSAKGAMSNKDMSMMKKKLPKYR